MTEKQIDKEVLALIKAELKELKDAGQPAYVKAARKKRIIMSLICIPLLVLPWLLLNVPLVAELIEEAMPLVWPLFYIVSYFYWKSMRMYGDARCILNVCKAKPDKDIGEIVREAVSA